MAKSTLAIRLAVGVLLIVLIASLIAAVWIYRLPGVDEQIPLPLTFDLTIAEPYDEAAIFLNDNVNIRVDTHTSFVPDRVDSGGLGNDQYEFWVDDTLVLTKNGEPPALDKGRYAYTLWIPWEAAEPGSHTLVVRGKNKYWNAVSNVVHVNVVDLASVSDVDSYTPQASETLLTVADKFGVSPVLLGAANPAVASFEDPLSPDKPVYIPKPIEPLDPPTEGELPGLHTGFESVPPSPPISKLALWLELNITNPITVGLPAAPTLFRFKEGCGVTLYLRDNSNNELGFYIYRLDPGSTAFKRLAAFGPHSGDKFIEFKDMNLFGKFQYYAASFNALGESADSFTSVNFSDKGCVEPRAADYKLNQVTFSTDVPADKTYCYYSLQESDWSRIPADPNAFFHPLNNTFNLSDQLSTVRVSSGSSLSMECWGWSGGGLIFLGTGKASVDPAQPQVQLRGDQFSITGSLSVLGSYPPSILMDETPDKKIVVRPPEALTATSNIDVCISHFPIAMQGFLGPIFCKSALETGSNVLVWEWHPPIFPIDDPTVVEAKEIDGYYVYKYYPGGKPILIKTINDPSQTVLIQPAESSLKLPVYFVRAFRNIHVSGDSNHLPLTTGGSAALAAVSIAPSAISTDENKEETLMGRCTGTFTLATEGTGFEGLHAPMDGLTSNEIVVGYKHLNHYADCIELDDHYFRGRISFDLSAVSGPVSKAVLKYVQGKGFYYVEGAPKTMAGQSCANNLNILTGAETFDLYQPLPKYGGNGLIHTVDVTEAVRDWVSGTTNLGFIFTGRDEGFPSDYNECWTRYGMFNLTVTYFVLSK